MLSYCHLQKYGAPSETINQSQEEVLSADIHPLVCTQSLFAMLGQEEIIPKHKTDPNGSVC